MLAVMLGISIIILLAVVAIPRWLHLRMVANESEAEATLKTISAALEAFSTESQEGYPTDISALMKTDPPYLNRNYIGDYPSRGYNYSCEYLKMDGYSCSARPQQCGRTGSKKYTITTGGVLIEEDCE